MSLIMNSLENLVNNLEMMEKDVGVFNIKDVKVHDNNLIMRHLTLLFKGEKAKKYRSEISKQLSYIICQKNGLLEFIRATCDFDQSSQKHTTFDQRFRAISTIISNMPTIYCSKEEYYMSLGKQIIYLLSTRHFNDFSQNQWKITAYIASALYAKDKQLFERSVLILLKNNISCKEESFSIHDCLLAIHHLIVNNFDKCLFISVFPNLFYIGTILHPTVSSLKKLVTEIIMDFIKFVDHSLYLIDDALFNHNHIYNLYKIETISLEKEINVSIVPRGENEHEKEVTQVDKIVQFTLHLFQNYMDNYKLDFFLLLMERFSRTSSAQLILYSLIDSLQESASALLLEYPSKAIRFVNANLERLMLKHLEPYDLLKVDQHQETKIINTDSICMVLQILSIILEDKDKLKYEDICSLKECVPNLSLLIKEGQYEEERLKAESIMKLIKNLDSAKIQTFDPSKENFHKAVIGLSSKFMPTRVHSLIELKKMIEQKNKYALQNTHQLLILLKESLNDPESYVYLAAVNSLSSLAILSTLETLPLLVEAFHDKLRTIEERVNVGQVLVQLSKRIGDMAHHYSKPLINCFLKGFLDENVSIRVSSISNLSQFCSILRYALSYYITEIVFAVQCLLKNDSFIEVKRACVMFIAMLFGGLDTGTIQVVQNELPNLYKMIKSLNHKVLGDDAIRIHAHLALEQIDCRMKEIFTINDPRFLIRKVAIN